MIVKFRASVRRAYDTRGCSGASLAVGDAVGRFEEADYGARVRYATKPQEAEPIADSVARIGSVAPGMTDDGLHDGRVHHLHEARQR